MVVGLGVGGRFGLAAPGGPSRLRFQMGGSLLAVAAQRARASSLLELPLAGEGNGEDIAPEPAPGRQPLGAPGAGQPPPAQVSGWPRLLLGEQALYILVAKGAAEFFQSHIATPVRAKVC